MTKKTNILPFPQMSKKSVNREIFEMSINCMLKALKASDEYTYGHSLRVAYYSLALGKELGLPEDELYKLEVSALFHDIGKIGVPNKILNKPARLDENEFLVMKRHPEITAEILEGFKPFEEIAKFAKHHHERFDGRGYPEGIKGEDIPYYSRIILIADTFDAMTSTRPYRKGLPYQTAFDELNEFSGSQFDPNLVKHFILAMTKENSKKEETFSLHIINGQFKKDAA
ncbi:MAG: HD-GYP domain-containing protein [Bacteriovoracaceae bacterium]|jgi:putative nucleotidyltransferase with HDIG domain|nr:HD-GYP domain-containing protein [Bacteriovoracaceae bacterium]